jgi:hypothetical protein
VADEKKYEASSNPNTVTTALSTRQQDSLTLDSSSEFESALVEILKMHRIKSAAYGTSDDPLQNFTIGGSATNQTPLRYGETLLQKHAGALQLWFRRQPDWTVNPEHSPTADDGFLDRAVYGILQLVLYRRDT